MTDYDTYEKFGVGEILAVFGIGLQLGDALANVLANIRDICASKNMRERESTVQLLLLTLDNIKGTIECTPIPANAQNIVQKHLQLLVGTAQDLEDRLNRPKAVQAVLVMKHGNFDDQVDKLRTGLADISGVLQHHQYPHHQYPPCGFSTVPQCNHMPPSAPAPPPQVVPNYYGGGGPNYYPGAIYDQYQVQPYIHPHHPGFAYHQPHVEAYPQHGVAYPQHGVAYPTHGVAYPPGYPGYQGWYSG